MKSRPDWDEYFLEIVDKISLRGECSRRQVGSIIVNSEHRIIATGYNGAVAGAPSCLTGACPRATSQAEPGVSSYTSGATKCIAIHGEDNAIRHAKKYGCEAEFPGSTLYCTDAPCYMCSELILMNKIPRIVVPGLVMTADETMSGWHVVRAGA